jgi:hypothetical protein
MEKIMKNNLGSSIILAVAFTVSAQQVLASGGGGGAVTPPRPGATDAFTATKALRATLINIDTEKSAITIKVDKGREVTLLLDKKTKYRAEDAKDFGGRKDLKLEDLAADINVRVLFKESDKTVVEVKVLKKK